MNKNRIKKGVRICQFFSLKVRYDYLASFSAHAALFMIMSLFPLVMFLFTFIRHLPFGMDTITMYINQYIPSIIRPLMQLIVTEAYNGSSGSLKWITLLVTLFCASKGFYAIMLGMNSVYGIRETRNVVFRYCTAIIYVVVFVIMIILTMILVVFGGKAVDFLLLLLPQIFKFEFLIHTGRILVTLLILVIFFLIMYINVPDRKSTVRCELPGAIFSTIGWTGFSVAFSIYISYFANYSVTYGSLATMIIFMVWFYVSMYILFLGAEINVIIRKYKELHCELETVLEYYKNAYELEEILDDRLTSINKRFDFVRNIMEHKNKK